jgi:hypothetical protein
LLEDVIEFFFFWKNFVPWGFVGEFVELISFIRLSIRTGMKAELGFWFTKNEKKSRIWSGR